MINLLCILILIAGGLNWGSVGFLQYDYIAGFMGGFQSSIFARLSYIVIALATLYFIFSLFKNRGCVRLFGKTKKEKQENIPQKTSNETNENQDILN